MVKKALKQALKNQILDCACVIHDKAYDWTYVEKLYSALKRNLTPQVRLHVYTEPSRPVPADYIKHDLIEFPGVAGPKKSWWYKLQLFREDLHRGPLLYLDLDTVIVSDLDWILPCNTDYFWAIHDFKHLWKKNWQGLNSSIMWFDTQQWAWIWDTFSRSNLKQIMRENHGDQDYLNKLIPPEKKRFFPENKISSYRWQVLDGGYDFKRRVHRQPDSGAHIDQDTSLIIFHGNPKPHQIQDPKLLQCWQ